MSSCVQDKADKLMLEARFKKDGVQREIWKSESARRTLSRLNLYHRTGTAIHFVGFRELKLDQLLKKTDDSTLSWRTYLDMVSALQSTLRHYQPLDSLCWREQTFQTSVTSSTNGNKRKKQRALW